MIEFEVCILAGGRSSRMGRDKGRIRFAGKPILQRIIEVATAAGLPSRLITNDIIPSCGPLSGIYTALISSKARQIIFVSCDMPFLTPPLLKDLVSDGSPLFYEENGFVGFPLVLRKAASHIILKQIEAGEFSLQGLAKKLEARRKSVPAYRAYELMNVNTPGHLMEARKLNRKMQAKARQSKPVLEIENLTIRRGDTHIVQDINWEVNTGEHWVILGANGSGKTSLLSTLTAYLTPTSGTLRVFGKKFGQTDWRKLREEIGLVSSSLRQMMADSEPALDTIVSGKYAMIDLWAKTTPLDYREGKKILRQIECEYLAERPWLYLSQGERQRVLIGRALMAKPRLLILDEPCAGLDPAARENFLQFLQRLGQQRKSPTLVLVTHHVEEIMPVFTHLLALKDGEVLASGFKEEVLTPEILGKTFNCRVELGKRGDRYELQVSTGKNVIL